MKGISQIGGRAGCAVILADQTYIFGGWDGTTDYNTLEYVTFGTNYTDLMLIVDENFHGYSFPGSRLIITNYIYLPSRSYASYYGNCLFGGYWTNSTGGKVPYSDIWCMDGSYWNNYGTYRLFTMINNKTSAYQSLKSQYSYHGTTNPIPLTIF